MKLIRLFVGYRLVASLCIVFIRLYQLVSPIKQWVFGPYARCRFHPTCSEYALECFRKLPLTEALSKSILRIGKCNPMHPGGHDPVPCESNAPTPEVSR